MPNKTITVILLTASISTFAADKKPIDYNAFNERCIAESSQSNNGFQQTAILTECADATSLEAKKEINALYKKLYPLLLSKSADDASKLEQSQKFWVNYRNSYCELTDKYIGSPMHSICPMNLNIQRLDELRELSNQFQHD